MRYVWQWTDEEMRIGLRMRDVRLERWCDDVYLMPFVYNKSRHRRIPAEAVYIGRSSKWGNPFSHQPNTIAKFKVATREEAIERYREYLIVENPLYADLHELRGKDLVCWCHPLPCHGDVLIELANRG
jgi:Domain of unknown function (DUF4326)